MRHATRSTKFLSLILCLSLLLSLLIPGVSAAGMPSGPESEPIDREEHALDEPVRVSIVLEQPAALEAGYSADQIAAEPAAAYRRSLRQEQDRTQARIEAALGTSLEVKWHLTLAANLISAQVRYGDIARIRAVPGVRAVFPENRYEAPVGLEGEQAEPNTANSASAMVGALETWAEGYTGAGSRIAVIDTGLDLSHQSLNEEAFQYALSQTGKSVSLFTQSELAELLPQLNAYAELSAKPSAAELYRSAKVPFGFNYVDSAYYTQIDHLNDTQGEHGSHVAGIAAANRFLKQGSGFVDAGSAVHAVGMAPDAQLFVMKVFGAAGGAYDSDYMVAVEDALTLGCDAVNLSLGSAAPGFSYSDAYQRILNRLADSTQNTGLVMSISAGNAYSFPEYLDTDLYIRDVSMHTGGFPGTVSSSLCVL